MSDNLVERLQHWTTVYPCDKGKDTGSLYQEAADRITALEAELREARMQVLASDGQAAEAHAARIMAEAERAALKDAVAEVTQYAERHEAERDALAEALAMAMEGLTQIERAYYQEATNPSPETIRRMAARMNGISRDTQTTLNQIGETDNG